MLPDLYSPVCNKNKVLPDKLPATHRTDHDTDPYNAQRHATPYITAKSSSRIRKPDVQPHDHQSDRPPHWETIWSRPDMRTVGEGGQMMLDMSHRTTVVESVLVVEKEADT